MIRWRLRAPGLKPPDASIAASESGGPRGFDAGKKVKGRKRHIIIDTDGHLVALSVHAADIRDRDGALSVIVPIRRLHGNAIHTCPAGGGAEAGRPPPWPPPSWGRGSHSSGWGDATLGAATCDLSEAGARRYETRGMALRVTDQARIALGGMADFAAGFVAPSLRLGVTGLSRSGKTVFITALVHALMHGGRLPMFNAFANGRIQRAYLEPQVHYELPRFAYEAHLAALTAKDRRWPESTSRMSELRLTVDYVPRGFFARSLSRGRLHIDILDYPGEWLLDLPLLSLGYREWSKATLDAASGPPRADLARNWLDQLGGIDPSGPADEMAAERLAKLFTAYLARCRDDAVALSSLPPGRFLMPGDLEGSPLLTFAPLVLKDDAAVPKNSLAAMMERRYAAYVDHVVRPFFLDHFARLDRQIVLVDVISALNAGPAAIADLKAALTEVLGAFRQGANSWLSRILGRRIDRILFAATKADLVHQTSHEALAGVLRAVIEDAATRARYAGARIDVAAIAAIRATREANVKQGSLDLPCIIGVPQAGESIGLEIFDGKAEAAVFPGDLPDDPAAALDGSLAGALRFVRFRPPVVAAPRPLMPAAPFPHIRLDRALEFLIGDRLT